MKIVMKSVVRLLPALLTLLMGVVMAAVITAMIISRPASAQWGEAPMLRQKVALGELPSVARRLPENPCVVAFEESRPGVYGGELRTLIGRSKSVRYAVAWGYARLVGYDPSLELVPDILESMAVEEGRIFTMTLRRGHRWSDGHPFTAEDFRYYWEDIANNAALSPAGPPVALLVDGVAPRVTFPDAQTVRYEWPSPNPLFPGLLARPNPVFIYRPAHYLKRFHARYGDPAVLEEAVEEANLRSWAPLHNRLDNMYKNDNPALPTLQPWVNTTYPPATRFELLRNPYFHCVDEQGRQLPYIDELTMTVASLRLIPAKAAAGESDLQARGLSFTDAAILRAGESRNDYRTALWSIAKSSQFALYPNLTVTDPVWREILRQADFRRALSLAIDRHGINQTLFFGLASAVGNGPLPSSPLYDPALTRRWADFDPAAANALLDGLGLLARNDEGIRLLPDGRPLEIIVETAGESDEETDILELITEDWRAIGVGLFARPLQREVLRNRVYAGETIMAVWSGWDNGTPAAGMSPAELAPVRQDNFSWSQWGQFHETSRQSGEKVDTAAGARLLKLYNAWLDATDSAEQAAVWRAMLEIHADEQFVIGVLSQAVQPVVVSNRLKNVPAHGIYGWDPGSQFGIYRPVHFWMETAP